ncbi:hypothetical protein ACWENQ_43530 [Nonomuraea sp. NPDC004354]
MLPPVADQNRIAPQVKRVLVALLALPLLSGCNVAWAVRELKADPAAVGEARSIGAVVAETTQVLRYENADQAIEVLIIDIGASSFREAIGAAKERLRQRGWKIKYDSDDLVSMESAKWKQTDLSIEPLQALKDYNVDSEPQIASTLRANEAKSDTFAIVTLTPFD